MVMTAARDTPDAHYIGTARRGSICVPGLLGADDYLRNVYDREAGGYVPRDPAPFALKRLQQTTTTVHVISNG